MIPTVRWRKRRAAVVKAIKLDAARLAADEEVDLRAAIGPKTRAILINSPLNPVGRVFSRDELEMLARVVLETDAVVICDEVYEHLVYDGRPHIPLATLPGMRARSLRIGSAGKIFSLTGWKVGWVTGPRELVGVVDQGAPVPHLHHFAGAAAGRGAWPDP